MPLALLLRSLRIASGLVLMAFVTCHLVSLSFGLHSLDAIRAGFPWLMRPWLEMPGHAFLVAAALLHAALALRSVALRRSFAMRREDAVQIASGLLIPILLAGHVVTVTSGLDTTYPFMLSLYWVFVPLYAIQQLSVLVLVWVHATIGLVGWASLRPWWPRVSTIVPLLLFAVPILALLGFVEAGKDVLARLDGDAAFRAAMQETFADLQARTPELTGRGRMVMAVAAILAAACLSAVALKTALRRGKVRVAYDGGWSGEGRPGLSLLEISRLSDVPHASVCSGRGRCGTCRVRVLAGARALSAPDEIERRALRGMDEGGRVRLACRARVLDAGLAVERLLPAHADASAARKVQDWLPQPGPPAPPPPPAAAPSAAGPLQAPAQEGVA
ncbi:MAG: 2Fe-2S iron-sulfur cluster-binding protein [Alsobacter sp.]